MFCIYGFVNKFWTGRIFERLRKVCGDSNLSAVLLLWGIYIKKCISPVRIRLQTGKTRNASIKIRKILESKNTKAVSFRLREAQHHLRRSRNIIGRKPTSFEAMPQHRSFVPRKAAMKLPLRANDVACATQMMLCLRHKWKIREQSSRIFGWGGEIRTHECSSQSAVSYRLTTPQSKELLKKRLD